MTEPTPSPAAASSPAPAPAPVAAPVADPLPAATPSATPTASEDRYQYGAVRDVSRFTRFLWFCAGADAQLLVRCPNSDRVKFQGLGGVVLTVGVLAFFSGSYAFYTVFSPKDATALGERVLHLPSAAASVFFGLVWALIIFNIDRFIISSTGKGDGTDKITWQEFVNSLPRLAMALIIGLCLSKPLEIKILESEIESALEKEQKEFLAELNDASEGLVAKERTTLREKIDGLQKRVDDNDGALEKRRLEIQQQRRELELEAEGKTGSGAAGRGPAWRDKRDNLDRMEAELNRDREALGKKNTMVSDELTEAKTALSSLDAKLAGEKASNLQVARHLDGLMKRIQVSHDIGGMIPIAIMLLLLCIEAGPIFFKLMVIKGAYDYLDENQKRVVRARAGIEPDARIISDGKGKAIHIDLHHGVTAVLDEEKRRLDSERAMATVVHEAWQKKTAAAIAQNPEAFVKRS
ncbi:MAG: DUF4407 domain-containing protein [Deltaproteobacteria bacterium]|nr:DUF4407 domain-containing protein [Deltaproteobacteria bacterium]